ncbi:MAG: DUF3667 domain-containing protein [Bacteroidota bacterium]
MLNLAEIENPHPTHCKSCGAPLAGPFCSQCGQKVITERFTLRKVFGDLLSNLFNLEKGFFHTIKILFVAPEEVIGGYIGGQTKKYYHPIRLLLILLTISALISVSFSIWEHQTGDIIELYKEIGLINGPEDEARMVNIMGFMSKFLTVVPLLLIPFMSAASYLLYKSQKLYYAEHCIANIYVMAQGTLLGLVPMAIYAFFPDTTAYSFMIGIGIYLVLYSRLYRRFFGADAFGSLIFSFITIIMGYLLMFLFIGVATVVIVLIAILCHKFLL